MAAVLRLEAPAVLLIRRVRRRGDPWSGDVAFPGGRTDPGDADTRATAVRETAEEVGLDLGAPLGRLPTLWAWSPWRAGRLAIVPWVFPDPGGSLRLDPREVATAAWVPWAAAAARRRWTWSRWGPLPVPLRGVPVGPGLLWGLTGRMVHSLDGPLRVSPSAPPSEEDQERGPAIPLG